MLVHEPTDSIAEAIAEAGTLAGRKVLFIATTAGKKRLGWNTVHPLARPWAIRRLIPGDTTILLSFSSMGMSNILPCLPKDCVAYNFDPRSLPHQQTAIAATY
jgi:hypothetical protein